MIEDTAAPTGLFTDDKHVTRCVWCRATPAYQHNHDHEWGFPVQDDRRLIEKISLEGSQAGLSWLTILDMREAFDAALPISTTTRSPDLVNLRSNAWCSMLALFAIVARLRRPSTMPSGHRNSAANWARCSHISGGSNPHQIPALSVARQCCSRHVDIAGVWQVPPVCKLTP